MFVNYTYYTTDYGGSILTESEFNKNAFKACNYISQLTLLRVTDTTIVSFPPDIITKIKKCACELAEVYFYKSKIIIGSFESASSTSLEGSIRQKTAGQVSISFWNNSETIKKFSDPKFFNEILKTIFNDYLGLVEINGCIWNLSSKILNNNHNDCCCLI